VNSHAVTLRALLKTKAPVIAPGVFSPLVGRLAADAGFEAIYFTGAGVAGGLYGQPDVGLVTLTELVEAARRTVEVSGLPLICDADTGFGGVLNIRRTVRDLEAAGVAALHIEDQQFPRQCGFLGGHHLVDADEMTTRVKAALDSRRHTETTIIARTEMFGASGTAETIDRANRYLQAGADMVFCNGVTTEDQAAELARQIDGPQLYNVSTSGLSPHLGRERLAELGYSLVVYPAHALFLALKQIEAMFADLRDTGTLEQWLPNMLNFDEWKSISGIDETAAFEKRYE
jgi:2-methylisocitrate lyase-like PEP mutase family enzyme